MANREGSRSGGLDASLLYAIAGYLKVLKEITGILETIEARLMVALCIREAVEGEFVA